MFDPRNVVAKKKLLRVCAWCQPQRKILDDNSPGDLVTAEEKSAFALTHGMCNPCYVALEKQSTDLDVLRAADAVGII